MGAAAWDAHSQQARNVGLLHEHSSPQQSSSGIPFNFARRLLMLLPPPVITL